MRVLHVTPYFAPAFRYGGPPQSILGLCQALTRAGVDVEVFTTNANGDEALPAAPDGVLYDGVRARYFPIAWPRRYWRAAGLHAALTDAVRHADLVHVHGLWNVTGWQGVRAARAAGVPHVISPRGMLQPAALDRHRRLKSVAYWATIRSHLASAAFLHATSDAERRELLRCGPPVVSIPNGVTPLATTSAAVAAMRARASIRDGDEVVTFLGRLHPIKRLDLLAEAFAILRRERPRVRLVIAGPDEGGHRQRVAPLFAEVAADVCWLGAVDDAERWALLAASRALVQCSDSESFGMSVAEALAAAVPVVVTERGAWAGVEAAGCGYVVTHDARAIAGALHRLLDGTGDAQGMGARAQAWAQSRFGWDAIGRSMRDAYQGVVAAACATSPV